MRESGRPGTGFGRRELLLAIATLVPVAGCARQTSISRPASTPAVARPDIAKRFAELEQKYQARLGVYVPASGTTAEIAYRAEERFAFCSTFKAPLVAAGPPPKPFTPPHQVNPYHS